MEYKQKLITAGELRSVLDKLNKEEISFSYAATMLSEIAEKKRLALLGVVKREEINMKKIECVFFRAYSKPLPFYRVFFYSFKENAEFYRQRVKKLMQ